MSTEPLTNTRVTVIDGWAVRDLPNGDQVRARLRHDPDCDPPENDGSGVRLVRERDSYGGIALDDHDGLREVLDRTDDTRNGGVYVYAQPDLDGTDSVLNVTRAEFVRRYLRAFWDVKDAFLFRHSGHSQSDWADIWVIVRPTGIEMGDGSMQPWTISREGAEAVAQEWSDWAKGDCYYVEVERRTLRDALDDGEDGWTEDWDAGCGGFIGDDGARYALAEALDVAEADVPKPYRVTAHD